MTNNTGKLFIVPTPIGNLQDMTYRAVEILRNCSLIAAEDTRTSGRLMKEFDIDTKLISYHKFNEKSRVELILNKLKTGADVAVISDAGTPGISDPAAIVVQAAIKENIVVETLPGATAFVPAIVSSGLDCERFTFVGFLPDKQGLKEALLAELKTSKYPIVFYESPHRILRFLDLIEKTLGNRKIVFAREISKFYETYYRGTVEHFLQNQDAIKLKGEFVVVVDGAKKESFNDEELKKMLRQIIDGGDSRKLAIKKVSQQSGENKNRIYDLALDLETK